MKKILSYTILLIALYTNLFAQTNDEYKLLQEANKDYTEGKYQDAVDKYQKLVNTGCVAGELYYNLANSYYRVGNYKAAILYYEKAKLLLPNNEDVENNLVESRKYVKDKIEIIPEFFITSWINSITNIFSEKAWSIISILTFILFLFAIIIFLYSKNYMFRKLSFYVGVFAIFFSIVSFWEASRQYKKLKNRNYAIVYKMAVTVKSAPNDNGTELFIIHEGLKVKVEESSNGWKEIKLADGRVGWLPDEALKMI